MRKLSNFVTTFDNFINIFELTGSITREYLSNNARLFRGLYSISETKKLFL